MPLEVSRCACALSQGLHLSNLPPVNGSFLCVNLGSRGKMRFLRGIDHKAAPDSEQESTHAPHSAAARQNRFQTATIRRRPSRRETLRGISCKTKLTAPNH